MLSELPWSAGTTCPTAVHNHVLSQETTPEWCGRYSQNAVSTGWTGELPTGQSMASLLPAHLQIVPSQKTCLLSKRQLSWLGERRRVKGTRCFDLSPSISLSPSSSSPLTPATPSSQIFWLIWIFICFASSSLRMNGLSQWVQTKPDEIGVMYFTRLRLHFWFLKLQLSLTSYGVVEETLTGTLAGYLILVCLFFFKLICRSAIGFWWKILKYNQIYQYFQKFSKTKHRFLHVRDPKWSVVIWKMLLSTYSVTMFVALHRRNKGSCFKINFECNRIPD